MGLIDVVLQGAALAMIVAVAAAVFLSGGFKVVKEANVELRLELAEAEKKIRLLTQQVGLLEAKTSLEPLVAVVTDQIMAHETRAQERHEATMVVFAGFAANLERIAGKP